jgi:hypothetical protein
MVTSRALRSIGKAVARIEGASAAEAAASSPE